MSITGTIYLCHIVSHLHFVFILPIIFWIICGITEKLKVGDFSVFGWLNDESKQVLIMESNINYIEDKCLAYPLQERTSY